MAKGDIGDPFFFTFTDGSSSGTIYPLGFGEAATALRVVHAGDAGVSVNILSGTITNITTLTGITNSLGTVITDSSGVAYSGSNPVPTTATISLPSGPGDGATATRFIQAGDSVSSIIVNSGTITTVTTLTGITNTIATANIDSSGVQYSGSNPIPAQNNLIAMTSNPAAVANAAVVIQRSDKIGRGVMVMYQVRELVATARASLISAALDTGLETTLLTGVASTFLDLVSVQCANTSTLAVNVDLRDNRVGGIITSLTIPANSVSTMKFDPPIPQNEAGNSWTATVSSNGVSGTTVNVSAQFVKNV